jgi:hypothetical protein
MDLLRNIFKEDTIIPPKINLRIFFYLLIIIAAGIKQLYGVQHYLDIPFFDETEYLQKGIQLSHHAYNDWGPSYNLWYFILSKFCADPVQLFYLNYSTLMLALPVLFFLFFIVYGIDKNVALLFTLSFLMQPLLVSNFTYVSHFCLLWILLAFTAMAFARKPETKIISAMTAAYICTFARQEFLVVFGILVLLWILLLVQRSRFRFSFAYIFLLAVVLVLHFVFGFLSFKAQGIDRSLFAFKQHFFTNYMFWMKKPLTIDEFDALDIFHGSKTMFQCMLANPAMFAKHVGTNILNYLINYYKYMENFVLPQPVFHYLGKVKHILFIVLIFYLLFLLIKKKVYRNIFAFIAANTFTSLLIAVFFAWSFFAIFFIFPERHYIILQFCWWIFLLALLLRNHLQWTKNSMIFYPVVILLLIFTPTSASISYYHNMTQDARLQPNLKTIRFLRNYHQQKSLVLFTTERGFSAYLPTRYHELFLEQEDVRPYIKDGEINISQFFIDKKVDIIYMNEKMQKLLTQTPGKNGALLLNEPQKMGFRKQLLSKKNIAYLLIRQSL